jgi:uncharacterized membrane protein YgcG
VTAVRALISALLAALLLLVAAPPASAGVDDFEFASFHAEYHLDRDESGHSTLRTRETLVAVFPEHDQNRGIKRAIPSHYRGFDTRLEIVAVTDAAGERRDYTIDADGDFEVLTIAVPEGRFVHGEQTYVIEYTQRDVTGFFADTAADEFYWDVNGTGWRQPFHRVSVELHVAPGVAEALTGDAACYRGVDGSTDRCAIERVDAADGSAVLSAAAEGLGPHENLTVAAGFAPRTFAEPQPGFVQRFAPILVALPAAAALLTAGAILVLSRTAWRDAPRRRAVIAQYEPPSQIDVFLAAELLQRQSRAAVAAMLDLAVRGNARLLQHAMPLAAYRGIRVGGVSAAPGAAIPSVPVYGVQALGEEGLTAAERSFAGILFPPKPSPGAARWFDRNDGLLAERVIAWRGETARRALALGLRRRPAAASLAAVILLAACTAVAQAIGLYALIERVERDPALAFPALLGMAGTAATVFLLIHAFRRRPLTAAGREAVDHLRGLQLFIRVAEADRIRMLQSARGAERVDAAQRAGGWPVAASAAAVDPEFEIAVVRVYELLVPYAVLFGLEREWMQTLAHYYERVQQRWLLADAGLPLSTFPNLIGGFVASTSTSYSGSAASSSSGGSGGGGSSGGGGGGGGGSGV